MCKQNTRRFVTNQAHVKLLIQICVWGKKKQKKKQSKQKKQNKTKNNVIVLFYFGVTDISGSCISVVLKACEDDGSAKAPQERLEGVVRVCVRVCVCFVSEFLRTFSGFSPEGNKCEMIISFLHAHKFTV